MADIYQRGDTMKVGLEVRDDTDVLTTPGTITLTIRAPDGVSTTYEAPHELIVQDDVGIYHGDIALTLEGMWGYEWKTTSPAQVEGGRVSVGPAPLDMVPWSLSVETLKRYLNTDRVRDDDLLGPLLRGVVAFAAGPTATHRQLTPLADTELTRVVRGGRIRVPDARQIDTVTINGTELAGGYELKRNHGYITHVVLPDWTHEHALAVVTGVFGMDPIPDDLADAIYTHAARNWKEREAMYADQVALDEGGAIVNYFRSMPPRVKAIYESYQVTWDRTVLVW